MFLLFTKRGQTPCSLYNDHVGLGAFGMAKFEIRGKKILEIFLDMSSGYVLTFSNKTFSEFFADNFNINIYDDKYEY